MRPARLRRLLIGLVALMALGAVLVWSAFRQRYEVSPDAPQRIILISMDTVRADRVSGYGSAQTTPRLREIAQQGVLFENFYAAANYTIPSTMSIMTGLDPAEHGVYLDFAKLSYEVTTLAEALSQAGYYTQGFTEGGYTSDRFGFDQGFERYEIRSRLSLIEAGLPELVDWIRSNADRPYFLFLQTYSAHYPYGGYARYLREHPERGLPSEAEIARLRELSKEEGPGSLTPQERRDALLHNHLAQRRTDFVELRRGRFPKSFRKSTHFELDRRALLDSYDERISQIDGSLGQIRDTLVALGQWDDTLLIVLADHGEAFFERPRLQRHDFVPFDSVLRVPLVVSYPRLLRERAGQRITGLAWHLDVMPTVLGLAGVALPQPMRGRDLTEVLLGAGEIEAERSVYPAVLRPAHFEQQPIRRVALRWPFKAIEGHARFGDDAGLLFDLEADRAEKHNLRVERAALFESMALDASAYAQSLSPGTPLHQGSGEPLELGAPTSGAAAELSEAERVQLEALGYVNLGASD